MDRLGGDFGAFDGEDGFDDSNASETHWDDGAHSNPPPSVVGQDERRMQVRAYNHWASLLGDQALPHIEDLEPEFLGDFGPYSVLLDFSTGSETPTLQYIGTALRDECRMHDVIDTLAEVPGGSLLSEVARNYLKVVSAQAPVTFEAESVNAKGRLVAYRGILLPYSSDYDTIDFVYAVVNWKEVADAATADALLEEIDAALEAHAPAGQIPQVEDEPAPTAEIVHFDPAARFEPEAVEDDPWDSDDNILELRGADDADPAAFDDLPAPTFGQAEEEDSVTDSYDPDAYRPAYEPVAEETPAVPKRNRAVDALGNPIGGGAAEEEGDEPAAGGITTAADYGLPDWDEEEEPEDDVDELVNPLANIDLNSRLLSLVNSGSRGKKTVDLATLSDNVSDEEDGEDERPLFKPKAPSVDTVLSLEEYDEAEDEDEEAYAYSYDPVPVEACEETIRDEIETDECADAFEGGAYEPVENSAGEFHHAVESEVYATVENEAESEAEDIHDPVEEAPAFESESIEAETKIEKANEFVAVEEFEASAAVEVEEQIEAVEEPFELSEDFIVEEAAAESEPEAEPLAAEVVEEAPVVEVAAPAAEQPDEPESLHGLLAAVNELAEAARTTSDPDRRALYEAVGKAFDISIKAVLASDRRGDVQPDIQPRDLEQHFEDMKEAALRQHG